MGTQPLVYENTSETEDEGYSALQIGESKDLLCLYPHNQGVEEYRLFKHPQGLKDASAPLNTLHRGNILLFYELRQEFAEIFSILAPQLKAKDAQLYMHSLRVQSLALSFSTKVLGLPEAESLTIGLAAFFHDLGKMKISEKILLKASGLTRQEFEIVKQHPALGANILSQFKLMQNVLPSVYHHHERLDGAGYPDGIRGAAIPLGARIIAIVDAFEVMTSHRIYQQSRTTQQAFEELYYYAGTQFDKELVELFCNSFSFSSL